MPASKPISVEGAILTQFGEFLKTGVTDPVGAYAKVLTGWPDQDVRVAYPSIYIDIAGGVRRDYNPIDISVEDAGDPGNPAKIDRVVILGSVAMDIALNVFGDSKSSVDEIGGRYQKHMGEAAGDGGIHVISPQYFDQEFTYEQNEPFVSMDTAERIGGDENRARTLVVGYGYEVAGLSGSKLIDLRVQWYIAEVPCLDVVPVEEIRYF